MAAWAAPNTGLHNLLTNLYFNGAPPPETLTAPKPTVAGRIQNGLAHALEKVGYTPRHAQSFAGKATGFLNDVTPVGAAVSADDAKNEWQVGNYGSAAAHGLGAILSMLPTGKLEGAAAERILKAYHGSPNALAIDALRPSRGGELGAGVYFSPDRETAAGYAIPSGEDAITPHVGVLDLDLSGLNLKQIKRSDWLSQRAKMMDDLRAANNGEWRGEMYGQAMQQLEDSYKAQGYHGIYDDWRQGVVFPEFAGRVKVTGKARR